MKPTRGGRFIRHKDGRLECAEFTRTPQEAETDAAEAAEKAAAAKKAEPPAKPTVKKGTKT